MAPTSPEQRKEFWRTFLRALGTVPGNVTSIRGVSGFHHPVLAAGLDEARNRAVLVSGEADARTAALAQADIQASFGDTRVVIARPAAIHLGRLAQLISKSLGGKPRFALNQLSALSSRKDPNRAVQAFIERLNEGFLQPTLTPLSFVPLNVTSIWKEVIQQLALLETAGFPDISTPEAKGDPVLIFQSLMEFDPATTDRAVGVCPVPLYEFSEADLELFLSGKDEDAGQVLRERQIYQYFFPPADQLALALAETAPSADTAILTAAEEAPRMGHPFGRNELVPPETRLQETVDALAGRGLLVQGEYGYEVSTQGEVIRASVRFAPREGFLAKLSRILSLKVDVSLKDLFK